MSSSITVITLTRKRPHLLERAIASVNNQDYSGPITHLVLVDDCEDTKSYLENALTLPERLSWHFTPRAVEAVSTPERLSRLRNLGARMASTDYVCYLDDDNEYAPNHLSSLVACARQTQCKAVHSHEQIFRADGTPYLEPRIAWCRDPEEGSRQYEELRARGVFEYGSNISRDRADPLGHPDPARTVDMGEWLFDRSLLLKYPFPEDYSEDDLLRITTEDDKLMLKLIENGVPVACTGLPTFKYYLGGFTNNFA